MLTCLRQGDFQAWLVDWILLIFLTRIYCLVQTSTLSSRNCLVGVQDLSWDSQTKVWTPTRQKQLDNVRICKEMTPVAYFLSQSSKTFYLLYDHGEIKKIKAKYPNRYETWESVPEDLKSMTKLKRENKIDVKKEGLKPVGDVRMYTPYGVEYVPLYRVPKKGAHFWG